MAEKDNKSKNSIGTVKKNEFNRWIYRILKIN